MRDPIAEAQRKKEAIELAVSHLLPLAEPGSKIGRLINWNDRSENDPRDEFHAAVEFIDALLNDADADAFLGSFAPIVRGSVIPALRRGRPPKKKGQHPAPLRGRWIAAVVGTVCRQYGFSPTHNPANDNPCGCSIVAAALEQLGIRASEEHVRKLWIEYCQL
jgi:hypothetical protein